MKHDGEISTKRIRFLGKPHARLRTAVNQFREIEISKIVNLFYHGEEYNIVKIYCKHNILEGAIITALLYIYKKKMICFVLYVKHPAKKTPCAIDRTRNNFVLS